MKYGQTAASLSSHNAYEIFAPEVLRTIDPPTITSYLQEKGWVLNQDPSLGAAIWKLGGSQLTFENWTEESNLPNRQILEMISHLENIENRKNVSILLDLILEHLYRSIQPAE